jgi:hypothetical protein
MAVQKELKTIEAPTYEPTMTISPEDLSRGLVERKRVMEEIRGWFGSLLQDGRDYMVIPGTDKKGIAKPALLKPGAETILAGSGCHIEIDELKEDEDPRGHLEVRLTLSVKDKKGAMMGQGLGSCSTQESRYSNRWVFGSEVPADVDKATLKLKQIDTKRGTRCGRWRRSARWSTRYSPRSGSPGSWCRISKRMSTAVGPRTRQSKRRPPRSRPRPSTR